jgi:hypothetical protein
MFAAKNELLTRPSGGYKISRSLRFRSSATAYLNRTFGTPTNNKIWTWSGWVKIGKIATDMKLFSTSVANTPFSSFYIDGSANLSYYEYTGSNYVLTSSQVFRDPSAWYHIVLATDTTQATSSNRTKFYINGVQITSFSSATYVPQNTNTALNSAIVAYIGQAGNSSGYYDGYLAEVNFIDGQALTPSSFGAYDTTTGVWGPKKYTGSYSGTNSFYLNFSDNSGATSTTIGKDSSGNSNNWTPNNISVTSGTTYDSMIDTPTPYADGGNGRGNYATWNPLTTTAGTFTNANLRYVGPSSWRRVNGTISVSSGKWYYEFTFTGSPYSPRGSTTAYTSFGFGLVNVFNSTTGTASLTDALTFSDNGYYKNFSGAWTDSGVAITSGDVFAIAVDLSANTYNFYQNNVSRASGTIGVSAGTEIVPIILSYDNSYTISDVNFGQRPFTYTPPSGFVALNTQNLPTPTIKNGAQYMAATTYTGNNSSPFTVTTSSSNSGNNPLGVTFQPDLIWCKNRSSVVSHQLVDAVRTYAGYIAANDTGPEQTAGDRMTSFNANGFSVGASTAWNNSTNSYITWQWKANGSGATNTDGTISGTVKVSANQSAGFSIVTWTGDGSSSKTVGHGLGVTPAMIITKARSTTNNWNTWHTSLSNSAQSYLLLNSGQAVATDVNVWGNTSPTSSVFGVGWASGSVYTNQSGTTYVAYCFTPVAGYSAMGSYTGTGSADGPFIYCGFRPRWLLLKRSDAAGYTWCVWDSTRNSYNFLNLLLQPTVSDAETSSAATNEFDFLSNGFKCRQGNYNNVSGGTYIYAAFAENPFKYSLAR